MKIHPLVWQSGFLTGGLIAALYLLCYLFRLEWVLSPGLQVAHWSVAVVGTVLGLRGIRAEQSGFESRGQIWRNAVLILLTAGFVLLFLQILVHEALDPTMRDALAEMQWEQMQEFLGAFGNLPISEELMQESLRSAWSWGGLVQGFFVGALGWMAVAFILSRFVSLGKSVPPRLPDDSTPIEKFHDADMFR